MDFVFTLASEDARHLRHLLRQRFEQVVDGDDSGKIPIPVDDDERADVIIPHQFRHGRNRRTTRGNKYESCCCLPGEIAKCATQSMQAAVSDAGDRP